VSRSLVVNYFRVNTRKELLLSDRVQRTVRQTIFEAYPSLPTVLFISSLTAAYVNQSTILVAGEGHHILIINIHENSLSKQKEKQRSSSRVKRK
jgi:hypothetical protein